MSVIYEPRGRAREYAELACNIYSGCDHGCVYCYAPAVTKNPGFHNVKLRSNFLAQLRKDAEKLAGDSRQILLCFTGDPYCQFDVEHQMTRHAIKILHDHGLHVSILTKGGRRAWRDFDLLGRGDAFGVTLTFTMPEDIMKWEPGAALLDERLQSLRRAKARRIRTWVSMEPVIYPSQSLTLLATAVELGVEEAKLGRCNHTENLPDGLREMVEGINWTEYREQAIQICERRGVWHLIKKDLAES